MDEIICPFICPLKGKCNGICPTTDNEKIKCYVLKIMHPWPVFF